MKKRLSESGRKVDKSERKGEDGRRQGSGLRREKKASKNIPNIYSSRCVTMGGVVIKVRIDGSNGRF